MLNFFGAAEDEEPKPALQVPPDRSTRSSSPSAKKISSSPSGKKKSQKDVLSSSTDPSPPYLPDASMRLSKKSLPTKTLKSPETLYVPVDPSNPYAMSSATGVAADDNMPMFTYLDEGTYAVPKLSPVPVELKMFKAPPMKMSSVDASASNYRGASVVYENQVDIKVLKGTMSDDNLKAQEKENAYYAESTDMYFTTDEDIARKFYGGYSFLVRIVRMFGINPLGIKAFAPDSAITDVTMFPPSWLWFIILCQTVAFFGLFLYFAISLYSDGRTKPFVSLTPSSGDCSEIPTTIIGTYMVDVKGYWQTSSKFSNQLNNFEARLYSLRYTSRNWKYIIETIKGQVKTLGAKSKKRNLAFNLVMLSSFAAVYDAADSSLGLPSDSGTLIFYSTADPGTIFNKMIYEVGTYLSSYDGYCPQSTLTQAVSYDRITATVSIEINLTYYTGTECATTFSPELLGADLQRSSLLSLDVNMNSVMTAIAVNFGIRSLNSLVKIDGDSERIQLLRNMRDLGRIGNDVLEGTSSYYDELLAPMAPIYCTTFTDLNSTSGRGTGTQCLVRIGNALLYPVIAHYGYYSSISGTYKMCTKADVKRSQSAKFGCNLFDITVGLVYYNETEVAYTYFYGSDPFQSMSPTLVPSPQPGKPSGKPTIAPTPAPSVHSKRPSCSPTFMPSSVVYYNNSAYTYSYSAETYAAPILDDDFKAPVDDDYKRGLADDDYQEHPFSDKKIDSGEVFGLLREAAQIMYDDPVDGDLRLMERFYPLCHYGLYYNYNGNKTVYSKACSPNPYCSMIIIEFYDPFNKKLSTLLYQPAPTLAYTDVFYDVMASNAFENMKNPPMQLTQPYYSCVLTVGDAFNNALGVAKGNVDLYLSLGIALLIFLIMAGLNNIRRISPAIKSLSTVFAEKEMFDPEEELRQSCIRRQAEVETLQAVVKTMQKKLDKLYEYNTELHDDIEKMTRGGSKKR